MCAGLPTILRQSGQQCSSSACKGPGWPAPPQSPPSCAAPAVYCVCDGLMKGVLFMAARNASGRRCGWQPASAGGQIATANTAGTAPGSLEPDRQLPPEPTTTLSLPPRSLTMRDGPSARVRCGLLPASHLSPQASQRIASWYQHQRRRQRAPAPLLVGISRRRESQRAACSASAAPAPCLACQAVAAGEVRSRWPLARRGHRRTRRADQPPARPSSAANLEATFAASLRRRRPLRARSRIAA